jgi:hypothetical protein
MHAASRSAETFPYDLCLSHSAKDEAVMRPLAERWRQDQRTESSSRANGSM